MLNVSLHEVLGRVRVVIDDGLYERSMDVGVPRPAALRLEAASRRPFEQQKAIQFALQQRATGTLGDVAVDGDIGVSFLVIRLPGPFVRQGEFLENLSFFWCGTLCRQQSKNHWRFSRSIIDH